MSEAVTAGTSALEVRPTEESLQQQVGTIESQAFAMTITTQADFEDAAELAKTIAGRKKFVKDFFEPMRVKAKEAYDAILGRKNQMMKPLEDADKVLRQKMSEFSRQQELARKQQEAAMRQMAQREAEAKLTEAAEAEEAGDVLGAHMALAEAEIAEGVATGGIVSAPAPKVKGVSKSKDWKITRIDDQNVPVSINGAVIRPVDEKAIMRLIRATKGTIVIPGVAYEETVKLGISSR